MMLDIIKDNVEKEPKNLLEMALKLSEESGEVAQAILSLTKASGSAYKELDYDDAMEECVDSILVAYVLFEKLNKESENKVSFEEVLEAKVKKWLTKVNQ